MNVSLQNIDEVSALLTVRIEASDYREKAEKSLKKLRQQVQMPGFRKGMVPLGLVKKLYGKSVLAEEVNKIMSEATYNYIRDNKVKMLGEPLPSEEHQKEIDFDTMTEFEFVLDIAIAPRINVTITADDHLPYYTIDVTDDMVNTQIAMLAGQHGSYKDLEVYAEQALLTGTLIELDEQGNPKDGGIQVDDATLMPTYMKDAEQRKRFDGAKIGDVLTFNPYAAWEGNEAELASLMQIGKDRAGEHQGNFTFQISTMKGYAPAEMGQKLFDDVFGEGQVNTEDEFRARVKAMIEPQLASQTELRLQEDVRKLIMDKAGKPRYADKLLKRIMVEKSKEHDAQKVEENYEKSIEQLTWHLAKEELTDAYEIKVDDKEVLEQAKTQVRRYYAQFNPNPMPDDFVEKTAKDLVKKEEDIEGLVDRVIEDKITARVKQIATLDRKVVSLDEFRQLSKAEQA